MQNTTTNHPHNSQKECIAISPNIISVQNVSTIILVILELLPGFEHLQTLLSAKSPQKHVDDIVPVLTKGDRQLIVTNKLYTTAFRLDDANNLLDSCFNLF